MKIDPSSGLPLYKQIENFIRDEINSGKYNDGGFLPREESLANELWTYNITSGSNVNNSDAIMFAWNSRLPLIPRLFPGSGNEVHEYANISLLSEFPKNVHLVNIRPKSKGNSILLHLRETDGENVQFTPQFGVIQRFTMIKTDVNGNRLGDQQLNSIVMKPYETVFMEVMLE